MDITTNNTEVILKLEKRIEELENNVKIAREFLCFVKEEECSTNVWSYVKVAKEHLQFEESKE